MMGKFLKRFMFLFFFIVLINIAIFAEEAPLSNKACTERILKLLDNTGFKYQKVEDGLWVIDFEGKQKEKILVVIMLIKNLVLVSSVVAEDKLVDWNKDFLHKLLEYNFEYDKAKFCISENKLFVRCDDYVEDLDSRKLKSNIDQVAAMVDEVWPYLSKQIKTK